MKYFLYLSIFLIPFYFIRFRILGIPTNVFEISVLITFILYLTDLVIKKKEIKISSIDLTIIVFLFFSLIAVAVSSDKMLALGIFKGWFLVPVLLYMIVRGWTPKKNIYTLAIPLFSSLLIVSLWSIIQKFGIVSTLFYQRGDANFNQYLAGNVRLFGPFESPNYLAMYLVPTFFLSLAIFTKIKNIFLKIVLLILSLAPIYVLYYTKSRGGMLAFLAGLLILTISYILNRYRIHRSANLKAVIVLTMIVFVFFVYRLGFNAERDQTRIEIYKYSRTLVESNYITGIGLGSFQEKISELSINDQSFRDNILPYAIHPHNLYIAVLLNLGIGGLIAFLVLILQFFAGAFRSLDNKIAIYPAAAMTAILAHGLVDTTYFKNDLSAIFLLTIALIAILERHAKARSR